MNNGAPQDTNNVRVLPAMVSLPADDVTGSDEEDDDHAGTAVAAADVDGDGIIGVSDTLDLLANFGCVGVGCTGDVDNDGIVGVSDILELLSAFGDTCSQSASRVSSMSQGGDCSSNACAMGVVSRRKSGSRPMASIPSSASRPRSSHGGAAPSNSGPPP